MKFSPMTDHQKRAMEQIADGRVHCFGDGYGVYRRSLRRLAARGWVQVNGIGDARQDQSFEITDAGRKALAARQ